MTRLILIFLLFCSQLSASDFKDFAEAQENEYKVKLVLDRLQMAIGDVSQLNSMISTGLTTQPVMNGLTTFPLTTTVLFPDKLKLEYQGSEYILIGNKGWQKYPEDYYEKMTDKQTSAISANLKRNFISIIKNLSIFKISYVEEKSVKGIMCDILHFTSNPIEFDLIVSQANGLPIQMLYKRKYGEDEITICRSFSGYFEINGIMFPANTITKDLEGNLISEYVLEDVKINPQLSKKDF